MSFDMITAAHAATTTAQGPHQQGFGSLIMIFAIMMIFFYFILWRPQNKRAKEQRELLASMNKGDEVLTTSGIYGKITRLADDVVVLTIADNVEIKIQKTSIVSILPKGSIKAL